eukprot:scaffold317259_cov18-Prasinocladus_malaysianus.AAC.1
MLTAKRAGVGGCAAHHTCAESPPLPVRAQSLLWPQIIAKYHPLRRLCCCSCTQFHFACND